MKQQDPGKERGRERTTQTFHLQTDELRQYGRRTGAYIGNANPNDRSDGFARWSDYIDDDSEDAYIPRESSSNFTEIQKQPTGEYSSDDHTKLPDVQLESDPSKPPQQLLTNARKRQSEVQPPRQEIQSRKEPVQNNRRRTTTSQFPDENHEQRFPFAISGVSNIKERKSVGRRSEQFLLDLLKSQKSKREQQKLKISKEREQESTQNKHRQVIINNQRKGNRKKSQKMQIQEPPEEKAQEPKPETLKQSNDNQKNAQKNLPRQLRTIDQKSQSRKSGRSKRVTINDKGKIKLPTDSFSSDFQYILPASLRKGQDSTYHKREKPASISEDEEFEPDRVNEPMDIIEQPEQEENEDEQPVKQTLKQQKIKKQIRITDDPLKLVKQKRGKDTKNKKLGEGGKGSARSDKSRPKKEKSLKEIKNKPESVPLEKDTIKSKGLEQKKKVRKGELQLIVQSNSQRSVIENRSRPQRNRSKPTQFWLGERNAYNKRGSLVARCDFSPEQFLEMVGFSEPKNIKSHIIIRTIREISIQIDLQPNQEIYSSGINYDKMMDFFSCPEQFDELIISRKNSKWKPHVEVAVDDYETTNLEEEVLVRKEQTFSLKNLSDCRSFLMILTLFNSSKKK